MKIELWSLGKDNDKIYDAAIDTFTKRLDKYINTSWKIIAPPKNASKLPLELQKQKEEEVILQHLLPTHYLILLDETGKQLSSTGMADFLQQRANANDNHLIFLIGGAFGVGDAIKKRANYTWSLSKLVFPHQIVRLVLAEQLYRACTINKNEKYHHQ